MRIERSDIYLEYLSTVEKSWSFLDGLWGRQPLTSAGGVPPKDDDAVEREAAIRNHEVWYYQQLALVGSNEARNAVLELSSKLYDATFHRERVTESLWRYLNPMQEAFLASAREDFGLSLPGSTDARAH
jgi:hypothetical protein